MDNDIASPTSGAMMAENTAESENGAAAQSEIGHDGAPAPGRPEGLPEKFWDGKRQTVRTDALIKSYGELEKRFGGGDRPGRDNIPESADAYELDIPEIMGGADPEVNALLHEAGFTRDQAQLVYNLASEKLMPLVAEMSGEMSAHAQMEKLHEHFGGADKWREASHQLGQWGKHHLSEEIYDALAGSYDGVLAMQAMMAKSEPGLLRGGGGTGGAGDEESLRELMRDPRYWRDRDPAYIRRVKAGYKSLYPE